jgi:hypothetical protein
MVRQDFSRQLILAVAGPVVAAVFGTLIIGYFLASISRRQQYGREDNALRHELVSQMTLSANELHFAIMHYIRVSDERLGEGLSLREMAPILHDQYRKTRSMGHVLDARLQAFFTTPEPRQAWHQAMDLLSVRYYDAIGQASDDLLISNAGPSHSGLEIDQLRELLSSHAAAESLFRDLVQRANEEVLSAPLRRTATKVPSSGDGPPRKRPN